MKELFDILRTRLPANPSGKNAKHETLQRGKHQRPYQSLPLSCFVKSTFVNFSSAIEYTDHLFRVNKESRIEIDRLHADIHHIKRTNDGLAAENEDMRRRYEQLRMDMEHMRLQFQSQLQPQVQSQPPPQPPQDQRAFGVNGGPHFGAQAAAVAAASAHRDVQDPGRTLPPLVNGGSASVAVMGGSGMEGIQYGEERR